MVDLSLTDTEAELLVCLFRMGLEYMDPDEQTANIAELARMSAEILAPSLRGLCEKVALAQIVVGSGIVGHA